MKANLAMIFATVVEPVFDVFKKKTRFTGWHVSPAISVAVFVRGFPVSTSGSDEVISGLPVEVLFIADILLIK